MKRWKIWVGCVALAAACTGLWAAFRPRNEAPHYQTTTVERGRLVATVTATGTLSALVTVQVGSQVSGRIAALFADFNSKVTKGQIVAKIDPQLFEANVEQARANVTSAQGNLAQAKAKAVDAKRQYERDQELAPKKLIAQADLDTAESNWLAADASVTATQGQLQQAEASLHQSKVSLDYTNIVSPINGVVISRAVDLGQTVVSSMTASTLFTIAEDLGKMQVDSSVTESDVGKLREGMKANFTVDAYPGETFVGKIRQVRNAAANVQNVVTYDAVIDVDNSDLRLKPGMTANVTVPYAERQDVLRFANAALRFKPPGDPEKPRDKSLRKPGGKTGGNDTRTVYVLRDTRAVPVNVKVGLTDGTMSELTEGDIHEGDRLATDIEEDKRSGGPPAQNNQPRRMFF